MPHEFGAPHGDRNPNDPRIRRPSNASRGGGNLTSPSPAPIGRLTNAQPQLLPRPQASVLSQQPRRSRNIVQRAVDSGNRVIGDVRQQIGEGITGGLQQAGESVRGAVDRGNAGIADIRERAVEGISNFGRRFGDSVRQDLAGPGRAIRGAAESAFPDLRSEPRGTPGTDDPDFFGEAPEGLPPRPQGPAGTALEGGQSAGRGIRGFGERAGEFLRSPAFRTAVPIGNPAAIPGALREAQDFTSGLFEGLDVPTDLFGADETQPGRPGATPEQQRMLDITNRFQTGGNAADLTNEINALPVSETARRIEERTGGGPGGDVERIGPDPTTVIRGTDVSQTRGGQGQGGNFPDAVFTEGFEFPAGTTDAELRDPERLQQLVARNSLAQSLRQVPAPGEAGIPQEQQARLLAAFDKDAAAESGQTTRSREELASLERRAAQANALAKRFGFTGKGGRGANAKVLEVKRGKTPAGADLGSDAFALFTDAQGTMQIQKLPSNRPRDERNTDENFQRRKAEFLELNEDASEDEASEASRFFIDFGHFPEGRQLR